MKNNTLYDILTQISKMYPQDLIKNQLQDIPRMIFNISLITKSLKHRSINELKVCDIGGGIGLFSIGCSALGMQRVVLIDDFEDSINHSTDNTIFDQHIEYGVEIIERDVVEVSISDINEKFDAITTFDSMEHWHNSPKNLFQDIVKKLNPGGVFILGVPNCVNLRKRLTIPFGIGEWSGINEWYDEKKFRGHVREPNVSDLYYIANDMGLTDITIFGRNWLGYYSSNSLIRLLTKIIDYPLRLRPQLCSDIYLVAKKPN